MLPRHDRRQTGRLDPTEWVYHVRRDDRTWLSRPEKVAGEPAANAPAFSPIIPDSWSFEDAASARSAALSHGALPGTFRIIPSPKKPGEWLARSSPEGIARFMNRKEEADPDEGR